MKASSADRTPFRQDDFLALCLMPQSWLMALILLLGCLGCSAMHPLKGIPSEKLPLEFKIREREMRETLDVSLLRQPPPTEHIVAKGDVLGIYIEGILGGDGQVPPIYTPQNQQIAPSLGFPVPVRSDGTITLPYVDPISVQGMSLREVEQHLITIYTQQKPLVQPGKQRIFVSLQKPRTYDVMVIRQEAGNQSNDGLYTLGSLPREKRGIGRIVNLPAYKNDVLHALAETGGLPGLDAENVIYVLRGQAWCEAARAEEFAEAPPSEGQPYPPEILPMPQGRWPGMNPQTIQMASYQMGSRYGQTPVEQGRYPIQLAEHSIPNFPNQPAPMGPGPQFPQEMMNLPAYPMPPGYTHPQGMPPMPPGTPLAMQPGMPGTSSPNIPFFTPAPPPTPANLPGPPPRAIRGPEEFPITGPGPAGIPWIEGEMPLPDVDGTTGSPWSIQSGMVVRIPLRITPGQELPFCPEDVILYEGDVVYIETREQDHFITGGLLGGGQFPLPRDYDLTVIDAISLVEKSRQGYFQPTKAIGGVSVLNKDVTVGASRVIIQRRLPNGQTMNIEVNLYQEMKNPDQQITVKAGDRLILQYTKTEACMAWFERFVLENSLIGISSGAAFGE